MLNDFIFLGDGREVPFDLEWKTQDEIINMLQSTLGNTPLVRKRDHLEKMLNDSPANFGSNCQRVNLPIMGYPHISPH
jgi:hypothetical protein